MKKRRATKVLAGLLACGLAASIGVPVAAYAALQTNYDWYRYSENASSYTISTAGQLKALSALVNGTVDFDEDGVVDSPAVDFAGKTITLTGSANFVNDPIIPIGTVETPFLGTFDGGGNTVDNFTLTIAAGDAVQVSNVGLFGYVGPGGSISNLSIGRYASISIERSASDGDYIENVGMVAGYCAGTIANCSNAGSLAIASEVAQKNADDFMPVRNVGGVVGQCIYDVTGCSNSGSVSVTQTASPDVEIDKAQLVGRVGGVVGLAGDASRVGTYDNHIYGDAGTHGAVTGCTNTGMILVDTPKLGSLDRFGMQTNAESVAIGGVVGYSQGSVIGCTNGRAMESQLGSVDRSVGYVRAENGCHVGGICGSLRGVLSSNVTTAWADDGADGNDPLLMSDCTNYGDIYGRVTVGGIVGKTSSYTTVTECLNLKKSDAHGNPVDTFVIGTRWNKPSPGGIAGAANGEVSYCANLATVASALWADEASRTLDTKDGYYAAGIVGTLTYFDSEAASHDGYVTPVSEVFGCYNAGTIVAGSNMRQRGIVGQNDGYVHDNVLVKGVVPNDSIVYGSSPTDAEASGAVGENRVYTATALRGSKAAEAIAFLNSNSPSTEWESYWVVPQVATSRGLNSGYPLLDRQNPWGDDAVLITDAELELLEDASFTGGESTPRLHVTLNSVELVENADYRVVAQPGATQPSTGRPYRAHIVGLGRYVGTSNASVGYDIVAGDFSKCTVTVATRTFDYSVQVPAEEDVTVRTPAGTVVDPSEYSFTIVDENDHEIEPVDADTYTILVTAREGSPSFTGSLKGSYRIRPASFVSDVEYDDVTIEYLGETYPWVDSTELGESDNPSTELLYTGVAVKPTVGTITYKGHELVEGTDYKVIYGNSNSDEGYAGDRDENNLGKKGGSTIGCVTIRYISGRKCNFSNYANMFFRIVDKGGKTDLAKASYRVKGAQISDGMPLEPVEIYLGETRLIEGTDYTISYKDNVLPGTATFVATGKGLFVGELSGSFEIESGDTYELLYAYQGTGNPGDPLEATVTGVEYLNSRDAFSVEIPETVEHNGLTYTVTAIGDEAFGAVKIDGFSGSLANESKLKVESVSIPATVRTIGKSSFGTHSNIMVEEIPLATVEIAEGSQLESIGEYAFERCRSLESFTVPAEVREIGKLAFANCTSLKSLRFQTIAPDMPGSVAAGQSSAGAFYQCDGVTVYGYGTADAAKALANANAATTAGTHGGKNFKFVELQPFGGDVAIEDIPDQAFTGSAITPALRVTSAGGRLVEGRDYTVTYRNNVDAGVATAVISGAGSFGGQIEKSFIITRAPMYNTEFSVIEDMLRTGEPASYEPSLSYRDYALVEGVDYTLSYADASGTPIEAPTEIGTYRLVATGKGNFEGERYRTFRILTASIADATVVNIGQQAYTGMPVEPSPNVSLGGVYLERDVDYVLTFANNTDVGTATATVRGINGYEGSRTVEFRIVRAPISDADVGGVFSVEATGEAVSPEPIVVLDGTLLEAGADKDYVISYERAKDPSGNDAGGGQGMDTEALLLTVAGEGDETEYEAIDGAPSDPGSYRLVVRGVGNYTGSIAVPFLISNDPVEAAKDLSGASVELDVPAGGLAYTGAALKPAAIVTLGTQVLEAGRDYVVSYRNNVLPTAAGSSAVATVHGIGAYAGSVSIEFAIAATMLSSADVGAVTGAFYAGGEEVRPALAVRVAGRSLVEGKDFEVSYSGNRAVGTAHATVRGIGGFGGTADIPFVIAPDDVSRAIVSVPDQTYTGSALKPAVSVSIDGRSLTLGTDYTVEYGDNVEAGTGTALVKGKGNYTGAYALAFPIAQSSLAGARVLVGSVTYTGAWLEPEVMVRVGTTVLGPGDFTVKYASNKNAGQGVVTVTGTGNYAGTATQAFIINPADLSKATVTLSSSTLTYTGKTIKPAVKSVKVGGVVLKEGTDYTVSYANNVNASTKASAIVKGKGNYTGSASKSFTIAKAANPMKVKLSTKSIKASALKAKAQIVKPITVSKAKGTVTYAKKSGSKKLTINSKTGKVTVKKGTGTGTYSIKVSVTAKGTSNYKKLVKTVTVRVSVK